jgi:hypothetical protein
MLRTDTGYAGSCSPDWLGVRLDYVVMAYGSLCMIKREMLLADRDRFLPTEDVRYAYLDFSLHMCLPCLRILNHQGFAARFLNVAMASK